jgi:hypothetical protein
VIVSGPRSSPVRLGRCWVTGRLASSRCGGAHHQGWRWVGLRRLPDHRVTPLDREHGRPACTPKRASLTLLPCQAPGIVRGRIDGIDSADGVAAR